MTEACLACLGGGGGVGKFRALVWWGFLFEQKSERHLGLLRAVRCSSLAEGEFRVFSPI